MSDLHTWTGLLLGWVLYAMFLTGTVSFFKEELSQWMRPELPRVTQALDPAVVAERVADEIGRIAPNATQWSIKLPEGRSNSVYAFWRLPIAQDPRGFGEGHFDAVTGRQVEARGRSAATSSIASTFNSTTCRRSGGGCLPVWRRCSC